jgi:cysteine-rich repeat protein
MNAIVKIVKKSNLKTKRILKKSSKKIFKQFCKKQKALVAAISKKRKLYKWAGWRLLDLIKLSNFKNQALASIFVIFLILISLISPVISILPKEVYAVNQATSKCVWWNLELVGPSYQWAQKTDYGVTKDWCDGKSKPPSRLSVYTPAANGEISGYKYGDANKNGIDESDSVLSGWEIILAGDRNASVVTDENGYYLFSELAPGNYIISEGINSDKGSFIQTVPENNNYAITLLEGEKKIGIHFANYFSACGNNIIDEGEQCDDGNLINGDGCSDTCAMSYEFPSCETLLQAPGDKEHYTSGWHQIVGESSQREGSDDVYLLENNNYAQCFCPVEGTAGTQSNWLKTDKTIEGWFSENGLQWDLDNYNYAVQNLDFTCESIAQPVCGNEIIENGEQCDDGNADNGDGCSSICEIEEEISEPQEPVCGNEIIENGEQCDDGNADNGDGCSSVCETEQSGDNDGNDNNSSNNNSGNKGGSIGGGGGAIITKPTIIITDEKVVYLGAGQALVTWKTNIETTQQVVYGDNSILSLGSAPTYGYDTVNEESISMTKEHSVFISELTDGIIYYFRPIADRNGSTGEVIGKEVSYNIEEKGEVKGVTDTPAEIFPCNYLLEYIKLGADNNQVEVEKLEKFLNEFEGENLEVNGIYEQADFDAVSRFQKKYSEKVLSPWNYNESTGYVYITTKKKINELYCNQETPLSQEQLAEIEKIIAEMKSRYKLTLQNKQNNQGALNEGSGVIGESGEVKSAVTEKTVETVSEENKIDSEINEDESIGDEEIPQEKSDENSNKESAEAGSSSNNYLIFFFITLLIVLAYYIFGYKKKQD